MQVRSSSRGSEYNKTEASIWKRRDGRIETPMISAVLRMSNHQRTSVGRAPPESKNICSVYSI